MTCFQITIFEPSETVKVKLKMFQMELWLASKLLSLNHQRQCDGNRRNNLQRCDLLPNYYLWTIRDSSAGRLPRPWCVVTCFQITIFEPSETVAWPRNLEWTGCDLLPNYYLWTIRDSHCRFVDKQVGVVTCFQITIFEPSEIVHYTLLSDYKQIITSIRKIKKTVSKQ